MMTRYIDQENKTMWIEMTGTSTVEFSLTDPIAVADILSQLIGKLDARLDLLERRGAMVLQGDSQHR